MDEVHCSGKVKFDENSGRILLHKGEKAMIDGFELSLQRVLGCALPSKAPYPCPILVPEQGSVSASPVHKIPHQYSIYSDWAMA